MTCSEELVIALLAGEVSGEERNALDQHLLSCGSCWLAVQEDRAGRLALEQLRVSAPPGLTDRVRLAVELAAEAEQTAGTRVAAARTGAPAGPRRRLPVLVAAACLLVAGLAAGLAATLGSTGHVDDPPVVSAIAAMATSNGGAPERLALSHGTEHLVLAGQPVVIGAYRVEGILTVVAVSEKPFRMPDASRVMHGSSPSAWMATRGGVGLWCMNAPAGKHSMLVAARMPAVQLPAVVSRLNVRSL